jgi:hypothetical protein
VPNPNDLTRADLALVRQALRQDWPVPPGVKAQILQRLIDYLDREHEEGATAGDRQVIAAARTLYQFMTLSIDQQKLDLERERLAAALNDHAQHEQHKPPRIIIPNAGSASRPADQPGAPDADPAP